MEDPSVGCVHSSLAKVTTSIRARSPPCVPADNWQGERSIFLSTSRQLAGRVLQPPEPADNWQAEPPNSQCASSLRLVSLATRIVFRQVCCPSPGAREEQPVGLLKSHLAQSLWNTAEDPPEKNEQLQMDARKRGHARWKIMVERTLGAMSVRASRTTLASVLSSLCGPRGRRLLLLLSPFTVHGSG